MVQDRLFGASHVALMVVVFAACIGGEGVVSMRRLGDRVAFYIFIFLVLKGHQFPRF